MFSDIGDILRSLLRLRGRARRIRDFRHGRILGIDLKIRILPILVLNLDAILCRSDFHIGLVAVLVSHIAIDVFCGLRSRAGVAVLVSRIAIDAFCGLARIGAFSLRIFGFGLDTIRCHIRAGFCPVSRVALLRIGFAALFRMGELALRGHTALFHLSVMSDTVCGNRSRAIMNRTIRVRLLVFHGNLAYIELAIDRQVFLYGDIFLKFCFSFCGQCAIDLSILEISIARNSQLAIHRCTFQRRSPIGHGQTFIHLYGFLECRLSSGGERTIDFRILKAGFTSHIERAIHIRLFELGIACDRECLIHGHVALELRSIFHFQRACVHSARRGDIASASIHAFAYQLAIRSYIAFRLHVANAIDSHIAFDRSFSCSVNAVDSGGALIGRSDVVRIGLNVICIRLNLALELGILRFEVSDIALCRCHFAIQRCDILTVFSDFPFQHGVFRFEFTNGCFIGVNLTFCGSKSIIESIISIRTSRFFCRDLILKLRLCVCNRCIAIRNFLRDGIMDYLISIGDFSVDGRVDSRIAIIFFLRNSGSNCSSSRICFSRNLAINFGLIIDIRHLRIGCEFRIYVISCCRNSISYSSIDLCLGICIGNAITRECSRFIRLVVQRIIDLAFGVSIGNAITCQRGRFICFVVQRIIDLAFGICIVYTITRQRGRFVSLSS